MNNEFTIQVELGNGGKRDRIVQKHDGLYRYVESSGFDVVEYMWDSTVNKWVCERPDLCVVFPRVKVLSYENYAPLPEMVWDNYASTHNTTTMWEWLEFRIAELRNDPNFGWEYEA